jgi:hypothetical protein
VALSGLISRPEQKPRPDLARLFSFLEVVIATGANQDGNLVGTTFL